MPVSASLVHIQALMDFPSSTQINLVYCAGIARDKEILSDYKAEYSHHHHQHNIIDFAVMASKILDHVPSFHSRFSHTACNRRFICIIEGLFIYYAIMDEALSKGLAYEFLEHVRDELKHTLSLTQKHPASVKPSSVRKHMNPFLRGLANPLVGVPQSELNRIREEEEEEKQRLHTRHEALESIQTPHIVNDHHIVVDHSYYPRYNDQNSHGLVVQPFVNSSDWVHMENRPPHGDGTRNTGTRVRSLTTIDSGHFPKFGWSLPSTEMWWRNVKLIIALDIVVCVIFLVIWLGVCNGVQCIKK